MGPTLRVLLSAVLVVCVTKPAAADPPGATVPADDEGRRSALYQEGVTLSDAGRWAEAVQRFRQVVAIRSAPPALFSLAQAEEHTGELATAERTYERALTDARAAGTPDVADAAKRALSSIEPRVPRLVVKLSAPVSGASAKVDGSTVVIGEPVRVDPGDRHVWVSAPGKIPYETSVRLSAGQSMTVTATLRTDPSGPPPVAPATPATPPVPKEKPEASRGTAFPVVPVAVGAVGIVAAAFGLGLRLVGDAHYNDASAHCPGSACTDPADVSQANTARTQIVVGNVLMVGGGATVAAAALLWFVLPRREPASVAGAQVFLHPSRNGAFASFQAKF